MDSVPLRAYTGSMTPGAPFLTLFLLLLAPAAGSFIGVVADRLPRGESVVRPGSCCRACGTPLRARDLVPVLSFLWLRGRGRCCGTVLPGWFLHTEITAGFLALFAALLAPDPLAMMVLALGLWLLLALGLTDLLWLRLPDVLTAALLALALSLPLLPGVGLAGPGFGPALLGALLGAGSFWVLRRGYRYWRGREGLGLGDVKLMAGLGALTGPWDLPLLVLLAALAVLALAAVQTLAQGRSALVGGRAMPFGAALCAAGAALWLVRLAAAPGWF